MELVEDINEINESIVHSKEDIHRAIDETVVGSLIYTLIQNHRHIYIYSCIHISIYKYIHIPQGSRLNPDRIEEWLDGVMLNFYESAVDNTPALLELKNKADKAKAKDKLVS